MKYDGLWDLISILTFILGFYLGRWHSKKQERKQNGIQPKV